MCLTQMLPLLESVKNIVLWVDESHDVAREMAEKLGEDRYGEEGGGEEGCIGRQSLFRWQEWEMTISYRTTYSKRHSYVRRCFLCRCRFIQPPSDRSRYQNAFDALLHGVDMRAQLKVY